MIWKLYKHTQSPALKFLNNCSANFQFIEVIYEFLAQDLPVVINK